MTSSSFNWTASTWTQDYRAIFNTFKEKLRGAMALFMPNYYLEWILRTDASNTGYGGVLYQVPITDDGVREYQPLKFISKKWSDA
ncbi:MAG: RNase H-like domain-containing protein, partial [bacterium]